MSYEAFPLTDEQKWGKKPQTTTQPRLCERCGGGGSGGSRRPPCGDSPGPRPRPRGTRMGPTWRRGAAAALAPPSGAAAGGRAGGRWGRAGPLLCRAAGAGAGRRRPPRRPFSLLRQMWRRAGGATRRRAGRGRGGGRWFPRGPAGGMSAAGGAAAAAEPLTDHRQRARRLSGEGRENTPAAPGWGAARPRPWPWQREGVGEALGERQFPVIAEATGSCCPAWGRRVGSRQDLGLGRSHHRKSTPASAGAFWWAALTFRLLRRT